MAAVAAAAAAAMVPANDAQAASLQQQGQSQQQQQQLPQQLQQAQSQQDQQSQQQAMDLDVSPVQNGKRKRDEEIAEKHKTSEQGELFGQDELYELIDDLCFLLDNSHPIFKEILTRSIASTVNNDLSTKRTKLSPSASPSPNEAQDTITSLQKQISSKSYKDLGGFLADFDLAVSSAVKEFNTTSSPPPASADQNNNEELSTTTLATREVRIRKAQEVRSLQDEVHGMLESETQRKQRLALGPVSGNAEKEATVAARGGQGFKMNSKEGKGQNVLTVYGADYRGRDTSKQWFSVPKDSSSIAASSVGALNGVSKAPLPNGIIMTNVKSMGRPNLLKPGKPSTLGELIPAPSSRMTLPPPTPPTSDVTRSQVVEWHKPSTEVPSKRPTYKNGALAVKANRGTWLAYSSHADVEESSTEKRIKRDRTLSGSAEKPDPAEQEFLLQNQISRTRAKRSSLFRSAFSSFAPSYDDTNAVISARTGACVWWNRKGQDLYNEYKYPDAEVPLEEQLRALDPRLEDAGSGKEDVATLTEEELKAIDDAVESGEALEEPGDGEGVEDRTVDTLLADISETIESLIIYQQDRLKTVPTPGRPSSVQTPNEAEVELYEMMRVSLMSIVGSLPPSALTRLDSNKLERLNLSTVMPVTVPAYHGTVDTERPSQSRAAPAAATVGAGGAAASANASGRMGHQSPAVSTPQQQQARAMQQPRSAYAGPPSSTPARPAMPQQYSVQQPGRFANQYPTQPGHGSPLANGYQRGAQNSIQHSGSNSAVNTPTRPSGPFPPRGPPSYPPSWPLAYQQGGQNAQLPPGAVPAGRGGSPQRPSGYNGPHHPPPAGSAATTTQQQQPTRGSFPSTPTPSQSLSAGHAASIYRPPSSKGTPAAVAAGQNSTGAGTSTSTIGGMFDVSPEEQHQISQRQGKQPGASGSPYKQQQQRAGSGSPYKQPPQPAAAAAPTATIVATPTATATAARPQTPLHQGQKVGMANGVGQRSPGKATEGVQPAHTAPPKPNVNGTNAAKVETS